MRKCLKFEEEDRMQKRGSGLTALRSAELKTALLEERFA